MTKKNKNSNTHKTNAVRIVEAEGIPYELHEYDAPEGFLDGVSVAAALGQDPDQDPAPDRDPDLSRNPITTNSTNSWLITPERVLCMVLISPSIRVMLISRR